MGKYWSPDIEFAEDARPRRRNSVKTQKPRAKSQTEELTLWFWNNILGMTDGAYTSPQWWRHMREAKILLSKPPAGRGYAIETIKRAVEKVLQNSIAPKTLFAVEWLYNKKTYYELAQDVYSDAPPIYDTIEYNQWRKKNAKYLVGNSSGNNKSHSDRSEVQ